MKYLCLRSCCVADRLWKEGKVYDLPDNMRKAEKNFKLVEEYHAEVTFETGGTTLSELAPPSIEMFGSSEVTELKVEPTKGREPKPGEYFCSKCQKFHRETSNVGKKHLKYKEA